MARFEEGVFNSIDDLVTDLQVLFVDLLVNINGFYELFDVLEFALGFDTRKVDGHLLVDVHNVHVFSFLFFLDLLAVSVEA